MRVLHVTPTFLPATEWGGTVLTLVTLIHGQAARGARCTVVTTDSRGRPGLPRQPPGEQELAGIRSIVTAVRGPDRFAYAPALAGELRRAVRGHDVAHVHGLWTYPAIAAGRACRAAGLPYVVSPHGMLLDWALAHKSWKKRLFAAAVQDRLLRGAALLHCTSTEERRELPARYAGVPTVVVPNSIAVDDLLRLPPGEPPASGEPLRLLMAGRIHRVKGFDRIVPALAELRRRGVDARLVAAGSDEGGYRAEVERMAREHGVLDAIEFTGNLDRTALVERFAATDLVVMPSYQENFGMAAAEAMAAGRAVVVTHGVNIAADIAEAGAGLAVEHDATTIAAAIARLANDPDARRAMGERGRRLARERYSPDRVASAMLDAYARATS